MDEAAYNANSFEPLTPSQESVSTSGISDAPTTSDALGFGPYVHAITRFLTSKATKPPLTLSIEGEWGSGKSSFLLLLKGMLERDGHPVVLFNAWRHDKEDSVWAAFALELLRQLSRLLPWPRRLFTHLKLMFRRFDFVEGWFDLVKLSTVVLLWFIVTLAGVNFVRQRGWQPISDTLSWSKPGKSTDKKDTSHDDFQNLLRLLFSIGGIGGYALLVFQLVKNVKELVGNPLAVDLQKYMEAPKYKDRVAFIENFHRDLDRIVKTYSQGRTVFIFIDDLDRCEVPKAADLIQALNLLMSAEKLPLVFIVAMDREKVAAGLAAKYEKLLPYLYAGANSASIGLDYGYAFIEKFIQLPFQVPRPTSKEIDVWLDSLNMTTATVPGGPGVSENARYLIDIIEGQDSPRFRNIVKMVAPAFDDNPRRLKQFINLLRLKAHIAGETGLFTGLTLEQLGKFIAITLRWPRFVRYCELNPQILSELNDLALGISVEFSDREDLKYWGSKPRLMELLKFGHDNRPPLYDMSDVDMEKLLRTSPARKRVARPLAEPVQEEKPEEQNIREPDRPPQMRSGNPVDALAEEEGPPQTFSGPPDGWLAEEEGPPETSSGPPAGRLAGEKRPPRPSSRTESVKPRLQ